MDLSKQSTVYLSKQITDALQSIVAALNESDNEQAQEEFLEANVEDPAQLLETLKQVNKKKLPKRPRSEPQQQAQQEISVYDSAQLDEIFAQKNDETILREYSLADLRSMYHSAYQRKAASKSKKEDLVRTLRRRYFSIKRGEAFARLANQRK